MFALEATQLNKTRPLLASFHHHLTVASILAGRTPGQVFVDDPAAPATAVAWYQNRVYLAGQADAAAQTAVHQLFQTIYLPDASAAGQDAYTLHAAPSWGEKAVVALPWAPPLPRIRRVYRLHVENAPAPPPPVPEGFAVRAVDADLLMDTSIADLDDLVEEMLSERPSLTNFLNHSFGVCLLAGHPGGERRLAGWCLSEYNSDSRCEVGIAVGEEYRRRGLATLLGRAFLEEAWRRGVSDVGWICWADNLPSLKTAEKLGFGLAEEREVYIGLLDEQIHLAAHGNRAFGDGRYAAAADWYGQALALEDGPAWLHWNAACAYARLDRPEKAFTQLEQAAAAGFRDVAHITASPHLASLHGVPRWHAFLAQLEQPAPVPSS